MSESPDRESHQLEKLLKEIAWAFPALKWTNYQYIDEGWDHAVIILDDALVFRFPTDVEYRNRLKTEIEVLNYFGDRVQVATPHYTYIAPKQDFAGYQKIPGNQLSKAYFDSLSTGEQSEIARQLAGFLSVLHTADTAQPVFQKVSTSYMPSDQEDLKNQIAKHFESHLSKQDMNLVAQIVQEIDELIARPRTSVFIHNDIYSRHLFWNNKAPQLGVIDFSDMSLDDPAIDFAELHEYGFDFVRQVYELYTGPKDSTFLKRAWLYQKWIAVYMMTDYFESQKTSFEVARETFDRIKQQTS